MKPTQTHLGRRASRSVLLGLATTLLACWVLPSALYGLLPFRWYSDQSKSTGQLQLVSWSRTLLCDRVTASTFGLDGKRAPHRPVPSWYEPPTDLNDSIEETVIATGFPFRAMTCRARYAHVPARGGYGLQELRGGIELSSRSSRFGIIPLAPMWWGLLADVTIWSGAWFTLVTLVGRVRSWRAARLAGRCRKCRYDLSGLAPGAPCPECGHKG